MRLETGPRQPQVLRLLELGLSRAACLPYSFPGICDHSPPVLPFANISSASEEKLDFRSAFPRTIK